MQPDRATAAGAVEEANAAVGAALSTGEATGRTAALLREIQSALTAMAEAIRTGQAHEPALSGHRGGTRSLAAGPSLAAALLRLARTVTERAARTVTAAVGASDYLTTLPHLLDHLAATLDAEAEQTVLVGLCSEA